MSLIRGLWFDFGDWAFFRAKTQNFQNQAFRRERRKNMQDEKKSDSHKGVFDGMSVGSVQAHAVAYLMDGL